MAQNHKNQSTVFLEILPAAEKKNLISLSIQVFSLVYRRGGLGLIHLSCSTPLLAQADKYTLRLSVMTAQPGAVWRLAISMKTLEKLFVLQQ